MNETEKYIEMYSGTVGKMHEARHGSGYGRGFFGEGAIEFIKEIKPNSLCDVGCGYGVFCDAVSSFVPIVYGVDIASVKTGNIIQNSKIKFIDSEAKKIPLEDNSVEWITSFDCLEHCLPEDIDSILNEFNRIASVGFVFSISYEPCIDHGLELHMTVRSEEWWVQRIKNYGDVFFGPNLKNSPSRYLIMKKK